MPTYQLTKHPVGTIREFWTLSWPLMLGLISSTLMIFVDRLFLARLDPMALNAAVNGGISYYMFLIVPISIAAISEVLVGRLNGENHPTEIGSAVWQMIWFGLALTPLFMLIGYFFPLLLFAGTGNEANETAYFQTLMFFASTQCIVIALSGFFIGIGYVKIVTISAILGNLLNVALDYALIFGWESIPSFGVEGAALATGLSQVFQIIFLFALFTAPYFRRLYHTQKLAFRRSFLLEGIKIGGPSGLGHFMELAAHFLFFRMVMSVGSEQMTLVAMIQSFYILSSFVIEAQSKAASAIVSNLLGADVRESIGKVLRSSFTLHSLYFLLFLGSILLFPNFFFQLFSSPSHRELLATPHLAETFSTALLLMCIFFLIAEFRLLLLALPLPILAKILPSCIRRNNTYK